jgi:hypothetical protein
MGRVAILLLVEEVRISYSTTTTRRRRRRRRRRRKQASVFVSSGRGEGS